MFELFETQIPLLWGQIESVIHDMPAIPLFPILGGFLALYVTKKVIKAILTLVGLSVLILIFLCAIGKV
ncbi:MAG: hypothetical protein IJO13_05090 [Lachnospiraceae bacterium]|nr:hypothetical protein [Lachnospiraceae bacterium]